ncbi:hypothetical protein R6V09_00535 [Streptomyces sp. W16]|uniref:hypothetical protein n=1 Tax=Streptomyces sp. W16 TaxID=3076631 RepID=UPI00295BF19E|nr:hypothetical protein [Streptomyces sp. W16]MDV9168630.1 hypothetical protein [Streptomyces sp. W16]
MLLRGEQTGELAVCGGRPGLVGAGLVVAGEVGFEPGEFVAQSGGLVLGGDPAVRQCGRSGWCRRRFGAAAELLAEAAFVVLAEKATLSRATA